MPVTLRQVAALAGVSPVVVSRVLHNKALSIHVADQTAERVREAAKELGYRRNVTAVNFRAKQTMTIGMLHGMGSVIVPLEGGTKYLATLMDGIIAGTFSNGYSVLLCPQLLGQSPDDAMSDGRCDGLILFNVELVPENVEMLARCTLPLVLLHTPAWVFGQNVPSIICDNEQGIGLAMGYLLGMGHRRIAFVQDVAEHSQGMILGKLCHEHPHASVPPGITSRSYELSVRSKAFLENALHLGIEADASDVIHLSEAHRIFEGGYTAALCFHDGVAGQVYELAAERGVRIPEDLSVVGFDSTSFCDGLRPTLTSVIQPLKAMGQQAAEMLVGLIRGEAIDPSDTVFPCGFQVRESVARI
jgi:LacI family transcriptional regulator